MLEQQKTLIKVWEGRASLCVKQGTDHPFIMEHLLANAETYRLCADELRQAIAATNLLNSTNIEREED